MNNTQYRPHVPRREETPPAQKMLYKIAGAAVVLAVLAVLWKMGVITNIKNFVSGLYGSGADAVSQSQQNFGSNMAKRRQNTEKKELGGSNGP